MHDDDASTTSVRAEALPPHHVQVEVDGAPLHVIEQGTGPAVLFVHGFPDTAETWRSQMRAVAAAGYRAIALDTRGYGSSHAPTEVSEYSALQIVGDLVGVLDALGVDSAVLVGHDWGADHVQRAMVLRPDRFRAVVSLSIPFLPRGDLSTWDGLREQGLGDLYYAFAMMEPGAEADFEPAAKTIPSILYWLSGSPSPETRWDPVDPTRGMLRPAPVTIPEWVDPDYIDHTIRAFEKTGFRGGLNHYRGAQATFDLLSAFRGAVIHQPSLYIWGGADGLCRLFHPTSPTLEELRLLAPGLVDVIRLENVGHWPQHEAADRVNRELITFLRGLDQRDMLRSGADVNHTGPVALPALMVASALGRLQKVESLLAEGADVHAIEPGMGAAAIHKAVQSGDSDVVRLLLDRGAFIDQQSPVLGNTPLMDAVLGKHGDVVRLLLERGARTTITNHWQQTALDLARHDRLDGIADLIERREEADAERIRALLLIAAVKAGDGSEVERLIAAGSPVDERVPIVGGFDDDYTPLGIASRDGHVDIVCLLLDAGADPRATIGLMRGTPVHDAAYFGRADVLRELTRNPGPGDSPAPELDVRGPYNGFTALHDAIWHGHGDAGRALIEAGARTDLTTQAGLTPRDLAWLYGYTELAELLEEAEQH